MVRVRGSSRTPVDFFLFWRGVGGHHHTFVGGWDFWTPSPLHSSSPCFCGVRRGLLLCLRLFVVLRCRGACVRVESVQGVKGTGRRRGGRLILLRGKAVPGIFGYRLFARGWRPTRELSLASTAGFGRKRPLYCFAVVWLPLLPSAVCVRYCLLLLLLLSQQQHPSRTTADFCRCSGRRLDHQPPWAISRHIAVAHYVCLHNGCARVFIGLW